MTVNTKASDWRWAGACLRADPELFFPVSETGPGHHQAARAKAVCKSCGVRQECLDYALRTRQMYGIWGGMVPDQRRRELRRRTSLARDLPVRVGAPER